MQIDDTLFPTVSIPIMIVHCNISCRFAKGTGSHRQSMIKRVFFTYIHYNSPVINLISAIYQEQILRIVRKWKYLTLLSSLKDNDITHSCPLAIINSNKLFVLPKLCKQFSGMCGRTRLVVVQIKSRLHIYHHHHNIVQQPASQMSIQIITNVAIIYCRRAGRLTAQSCNLNECTCTSEHLLLFHASHTNSPSVPISMMVCVAIFYQ